ncbi:MAG: hypothetical protein C4K60_07045 [Ideonella sp. MAG2]|nr:MAG: hypothetical protein C4K60_07045 [Ideonella sp. MAG2]
MTTFHHWQIRGKLIASFGITLGLVLMVLGTVIYLTFADAVRGSQARIAVLNAKLASTVVVEHATELAQALQTGQPLSAPLRQRLGGLGLPLPTSLTLVDPTGRSLVLQAGEADLRSVMAQLQAPTQPSPRPARLSAAQDFDEVAHIGPLFVRAEPLAQYPGWTLYFAVPEAIFLADVVALKNRIIAATVVVLWVSVWIVLIIAHRLTLPVKALSGVMAASDPIQNDTPQGLLERGDEIGELARAFEAMRGRLRALIHLNHRSSAVSSGTKPKQPNTNCEVPELTMGLGTKPT